MSTTRGAAERPQHSSRTHQRTRLLTRFALATAAAALAASTAVPVTLAAPDKPSIEYVLTENNGNPEGVAWDPSSQTFFTGTVTNGTIYRGTLGDTSVAVWVAGAAGRSAVGMKVDGGLLYVAGGMTGRITVYDIDTAAVVATFETGAGGFLNDLVVTKAGVFVTDSFRPVLWHVSREQVEAGGGTPASIPVAPEIPFTGGFALNGIVAFNGGRELIVVHSGLGTLYRIDFTDDGRSISLIDAPPVPGDGLLVDQGMLIAVLGNSAELARLDLNADHSSAVLLGTRTDPTFQRPSTLARAHNLYLVVNADFTTNTPPFTLTGLPRQ
jgi:Cu-Zn family superoxide dismutase